MKKIHILCTLILSLFFIGCEEEFNPKTEFHEKYAIYGIVNNMPQTPNAGLSVVILKTYDVEGYNPSSDHADHSVADVIVTFSIGDKNFVLRCDTLRRVTNTFQPKYTFTLNNISLPSNQELKIKAEFPDGKILTARTKVPEPLSILEFSFPFNSGVTSKLNRFIWGDTWKINWDSFDDYLYFPRLQLNYWIVNDSTRRYKSVDIPMKYIKKNGKFEPVFPSYSWDKQIEYSYDCIDSVMNQISAGDTAKNNYVIRNITFGMLEFETNLASYFSSTNGYLDNFSIRLDESIYSNISGGIGVFGAHTTFNQIFKVERAYVESFGYTWMNY